MDIFNYIGRIFFPCFGTCKILQLNFKITLHFKNTSKSVQILLQDKSLRIPII